MKFKPICVIQSSKGRYGVLFMLDHIKPLPPIYEPLKPP